MSGDGLVENRKASDADITCGYGFDKSYVCR